MEESQQKLLFVTNEGATLEDEFSYVLYLAKTLKAGIAVLMVQGEKTLKKYEDMMTAVTFAEAGEHQTAKEIMESHKRELEEAEARKIAELTGKCRDASINVTCETSSGDMASAVEEFISKMPGLEIVLLSPGLSKDKDEKTIKRLLRKISRPVVTLTRSEPTEA